MLNFTLQTEYIELYKLLKVMNLCGSGGEAKYFISEGQVQVDGEIELRKACKIRGGQCVEFDGQKILLKPHNISI